jgi:hypothetical protein
VVIYCFITTGHVSSVSFINLLLILIGHAQESGWSNEQIEICCCLTDIRMFDSVTVYLCWKLRLSGKIFCFQNLIFAVTFVWVIRNSASPFLYTEIC